MSSSAIAAGPEVRSDRQHAEISDETAISAVARALALQQNGRRFGLMLMAIDTRISAVKPDLKRLQCDVETIAR